MPTVFSHYIYKPWGIPQVHSAPLPHPNTAAQNRRIFQGSKYPFSLQISPGPVWQRVCICLSLYCSCAVAYSAETRVTLSLSGGEVKVWSTATVPALTVQSKYFFPFPQATCPARPMSSSTSSPHSRMAVIYSHATLDAGPV